MDDTRQKDPLGLVAVICGAASALSLPFTLVPLLGCLCFPLGPVGSLAALGFGLASVFRTGEGAPYSGRITAVTGMVLGLAYWLLIAGLYLALGDGSGADLRRLITTRGH